MGCWCKGHCPVIRGPKLQLARGDKDGAEQALKLALLDAPQCVEANMTLAGIYNETNRAPFAVIHLERANKTMGGELTPRMAMALAANLRQQTKIPEAVKLYRLAVQLDPAAPAAVAGLIGTLEAAGESGEGVELYTEAVKRWPENLDLRHAGAAACAGVGDFPAAVAALTAPNLRPVDFLARGRWKDRAGDYAGAWADWTRGKEQLRARGKLVFQAEHFESMIGELEKMATPKAVARLAKSRNEPKPSPAPLFVTGFPRSGTTMTETAIACHSQVIAGDELPMLNELMRLSGTLLNVPAPYPAVLYAADTGDNMGAVSIMRQWYQNRARFRLFGNDGWPAGKSLYTDKMPLNELHVPFIRLLFPSSPILWVHRHPLDTLVSNFSYYIAHGFSYSAGLESTARAIAATYGLVQKYLKIWPGGIFPVKYESFVSDPAAVIPAALKFCGLEPEPACIAFHESDRHSRTISYRQIKEPVYTRSKDRWRHYRQFIPAHVIELVKPVCEGEGYEL